MDTTLFKYDMVLMEPYECAVESIKHLVVKSRALHEIAEVEESADGAHHTRRNMASNC